MGPAAARTAYPENGRRKEPQTVERPDLNQLYDLLEVMRKCSGGYSISPARTDEDPSIGQNFTEGGVLIPKFHLHVYGTLDELLSLFGFAPDPKIVRTLPRKDQG